LEYITLDGIIQAPGAPDEDGAYPHGGWAAPYDDPVVDEALGASQGGPFDLLLGRRTYDIWAGHWPAAKGPMAAPFNAATKFVATHRPESLGWGPAESLGTNFADGVRRLKADGGPDLILWGSSTLTPVLLEHGLADEVVLIVVPVLLGLGKRLFADGTPPRALELIRTRTGASGVMVHHFVPAGPLRTGTFGQDDN
jgi:dihydrofolate reductase